MSLAIISLTLAVGLLAVAIALWLRLRRTRARYAVIIDAEAHAKSIRERADEMDKLVRKAEEQSKRRVEDLESQAAQRATQIEQGATARAKAMTASISAKYAETEAELRSITERYRGAKDTYDRLQHDVSMLEENLEDISYGLYRPHYSFDASAKYKAALDDVYEQKKAMVRAGLAASSPVTWTVGDSKREGDKMIKQQLKLMLRAFNGESDAAVAKVAWNNATKMEERIRKAYESINAMGGVLQASVAPAYLELALAELRLTHEHEVKKYEEREEQRQIREQMREEEKAQREFERSEREALAEEARFEKALERARVEVQRAQGAQREAVEAKIRELEERLAEAHAKAQRAISMAQLTRAGYVYVISNIGSFGENVFKVGMTRRLEPMERVQELGDASVPFYFDVHAMIYSDDAPGLENAFHRQFALRRLNLVNMRKEFFRVDLAELERFALQHRADIQFTKIAEAREYRESLAKLAKDDAPVVVKAPAFPNTLEVSA